MDRYQLQVVVATNLRNDQQEILDAICHANNVCFIGVNNYGLAVRIFCDFGESFYVSDIDDSEPGTVLIGDISQVGFSVSTKDLTRRTRRAWSRSRRTAIPSRTAIWSLSRISAGWSS